MLTLIICGLVINIKSRFLSLVFVTRAFKCGRICYERVVQYFWDESFFRIYCSKKGDNSFDFWTFWSFINVFMNSIFYFLHSHCLLFLSYYMLLTHVDACYSVMTTTNSLRNARRKLDVCTHYLSILCTKSSNDNMAFIGNIILSTLWTQGRKKKECVNLIMKKAGRIEDGKNLLNIVRPTYCNFNCLYQKLRIFSFCY